MKPQNKNENNKFEKIIEEDKDSSESDKEIALEEITDENDGKMDRTTSQILREDFEEKLLKEEIQLQNNKNYEKRRFDSLDVKNSELKIKFESIGTLIITGASGYLGCHLTEQALKNNYKVVAGIHKETKINKLEKLNALKKEFPDNLELIQFSMQNLNEVKNLLKRGDCVIHCATLNRENEEVNSINVLYPEIEGILNLLSTCEEFEIKRFILIGCISNVITGKFKKMYNEKHWADPNLCDTYERAKFLVEKTAWKFLDHKNDVLKLTVFLPGLLIGPLTKENETSPNILFFKKILREKIDNYLKIKIPVVDVRDLVNVVLHSIKNVSSFNQRYIINEGVYWLEEILNIFLNRQNNDSNKPNKNNSFVSRILMKFLSYFDKDLKKIINFSGKNYKINNDKSKKELKIHYRSVLESLFDMKESLVNFGYLTASEINN